MFRITNKIAITVSLVAVCFGQSYASHNEIETIENNRQIVIANQVILDDVFQVILAQASNGTRPDTFRLVCKPWKNIMDKNNNPNEKNTLKQQGVFMQLCTKIWDNWSLSGKFKTGVLRYADPQRGEQLLKFADLGIGCKGTFDLSACGQASEILVITTDMERFCEIGGNNQDKMVMLISPHQEVAQEIKLTEKHPFAEIISVWDAAEAPVGIFCRDKDGDLSYFDCQISSSLSCISSKNLFENWRDCLGDPWSSSYKCSVKLNVPLCSLLKQFSCSFVNKNKDIDLNLR